MNIVLKTDGYTFYLNPLLRRSLPHIHVRRENRYGKFLLIPPALDGESNLTSDEIAQVLELVQAHQPALQEAWMGHFAGQPG
jgi:hypothetical protein